MPDKNGFWLFFAIVLAFALFFLIVSVASANHASMGNIDSSATTTISISSDGATNTVFQFLGTGWTGHTLADAALIVRFDPLGQLPGWTYARCVPGNIAYDEVNDKYYCLSFAHFVSGGSSAFESLGDNFYKWTPGAFPFGLTADDYLFFGLRRQSAGSSNFIIYGGNIPINHPVPNNAFNGENAAQGFLPFNAIYWTHNLELKADIVVTYPVNEGEYVDNDDPPGGLISWTVEINNVAGDLVGELGFIEINYSKAPITLPPVFTDFGIIILQDTLMEVTMPKTRALPPGEWEVQAFLYDEGENLLGISPVISFTILEGEGFLPQPDFPEFTDPDFGFLGNYLVAALRWLFIPSQNSVSRFGDLKIIIETKPPVGYFILVKDKINAIDEKIEGDFVFPDEINELDAFNTLKTGVGVLFWFAGAIWIFKRFKHIEL